ncbi:tRNA glutamyl-Q(34) synthetase GluQRS [Vibrio sp. SS-MA-C1-2]|uniref:tRNA glutamyl-Q(34) synthetase GluQRS n=1 Tax=Vibrio sp. SS-MA-C1-2 TaxID=2908646 RepID=UPI001F45CF54|nr:tRNA glutamyl-Q(34) synthetase GluQRS [Vibrio sp. SS-MA-C1-2]UJF19643.1 tRNA glutamyl-Q(34) synthetase GluQRS [Vibrio sp. SS-MA-C1-2]
MSYIGRFAPSPSGALHFGSLVAALGSYLQAKANNGLWLVRMEDLDPPREQPGAAADILSTLEKFGLHWDKTVVYQSQRHDLYQHYIDQWLASGEAYYCQCTRKQIKVFDGYYPGTCRDKQLSTKDTAIRIKVKQPELSFNDLHYGRVAIPSRLAEEDFIIRRRDGLYAYNLAVVIDDIEQGVTEVVRGADLIEPTGRQITLYKILEHQPVNYLHLPLAVNSEGNKLSKQNHAPAISEHDPVEMLILALQFLGLSPPMELRYQTTEATLNWAVHHWDISQLPNSTEVTSTF